MASKKKPAPKTTANIWFKNPELPTLKELIKFGKEIDKQYPNDTKTRNFVRKKIQAEIGVTDPWDDVGCNWSEYARQCGWKEDRATSKLKNQASKHTSVDAIRPGSDERLTWGQIYDKPDNGERYKTIMGAGDFHDIECDEFAWRMWIEKLKAVQPDVIAIHGDMFDAPEFSRHYQDPREFEMLKRIRCVHNMFEEMREICPDAQIDLIEGNHEARIHRHILEGSAPTAVLLTEFHKMGIRELLGLDKYQVNYIAKGDLYAFTDAQIKKATCESERIYWKTVWVRHHPPKEEDTAMAGFHGHHHKHWTKTHWNPQFGSYEWHQLGGMHKRTASYTNGRMWNCGFITGVVDTQYSRVNWEYTTVGDTFCQLGGQFFERRPEEYYPALDLDLKNAPVAPQKNYEV